MKKEYTTPTAELEVFELCDVITTSDWTLPEVPVDGNNGGRSQFNW